MTITAEDLVRREVHYCVSSLVSTLAKDAGAAVTRDLSTLLEQAMELASPVLDYEEAAREAGWEEDDHEVSRHDADSNDPDALEHADDWQDACEASGVDPHEWEVFEHWIVSDWLADKLLEHGEKVDKDFAGLTVWARTCTGQGIAADAVIEKITAELNGEA